MSKGGGQGSFAQMQEPGMSMDMSGFGGGVDYLGGSNSFNESFNPGPYQDTIAPQPQPFDAGLLSPQDNRQGMPSLPPQGGLSDNITGFIPYSPDNASGGPGRTVIGGEGLLQELRPLPQPGGFGAAMERFNNLSQRDRERLGDLRVGDIFGSGPQRVTDIQTQGPESLPRLEELMRMNEVSGPAGPDPLSGVDLNRFSGGLGSKGGRSNPYQTDGIVPPVMRGQPLPGRFQFDPIDQPIPRVVNPPRTSRYTEADYSNAEAQAREILGLPPKSGGRVFAGGTPNFDERTGEYRTGGIKPPRGPVKLEPIKMQPMPMPRREPPVFGPPRNFPFPMPRPPRMPPRQPPRMPGRNTQFQMPFFGSPYGQMNPYAGQFSGYGVPSNMFSFAQPHYQPYVPPPPAQSAPPVMQLPPGQGGNQVFSGAPVAYTPPAPVAFGGGFGGQGIGGFGRYNLGLAGRQFRGR